MKRHRITIEITGRDLARAREEFPTLAPDRDPGDWTKDDLVHALATLHHRHFEIVSAETAR